MTLKDLLSYGKYNAFHNEYTFEIEKGQIYMRPSDSYNSRGEPLYIIIIEDSSGGYYPQKLCTDGGLISFLLPHLKHRIYNKQTLELL